MTETKGRPARGRTTKQVGVTLPHELIPLFKKIGGSAWLRTKLEEEMRKWPETVTLVMDERVGNEYVAYSNLDLFEKDMTDSFGEPEEPGEYDIDQYSTADIELVSVHEGHAIYADRHGQEWKLWPDTPGRYSVS